jgi:hypothetical protein
VERILTETVFRNNTGGTFNAVLAASNDTVVLVERIPTEPLHLETILVVRLT